LPVIYEINRNTNLIRTRCVGNVTFEEVVGHFAELECNPQVPKQLDVLLDLSELTSVPGADQLVSVAEEIGRIEGKVQFGLCGIIAPSDLLFGMSRMFEVFAARQFRATKVFRRMDDAEKWLASPIGVKN